MLKCSLCGPSLVRKGLFYRARQLVKHSNLYMTWTQKGNVLNLVRKEESGKITQVTSYNDFKSLIEEQHQLLSEYNSSEVCSTSPGDLMSHISDYDY